MSQPPSDNQGDRKSAFDRALMLAGLLLAALVLISVWWGVNYTSILRWLAELEFRLFGWWHPVITALVFGGLFALIWRLTRWGRGRRLRNAERESAAERREALISLRRLYGILLIAGGLAGAVAIAAFANWLTLPSSRDAALVATVQDLPLLREGPVRIVDARAIGPVSRYQEGLLGLGRDQYFVPVRARSTPLGPEFELFVEVPHWRNPTIDPQRTGILRSSALPGELGPLYRSRGMRVSRESSVVFRDEASSSRGTLFLLFESLIAALIALSFAFFVRRRLRRLDARPTEL